MTTNPTTANASTTSTSPASGTLSNDDPRVVFAKAAALAATVIDRVDQAQLTLPTPCTEMDVRTLLSHLIVVIRRVTALGAGTNPFAVGDGSDVADDAFAGQWHGGVELAAGAWADDTRLEAPVILPWATTTGAGALAMYTNEVTLHTWDLAVATGQHPQWDDQVLQVSWDSIQTMLPANRVEMFEAVRAKMPAGTPFAYPYGDALPASEHGPLIDRLLAWSGRSV